MFHTLDTNGTQFRHKLPEKNVCSGAPVIGEEQRDVLPAAAARSARLITAKEYCLLRRPLCSAQDGYRDSEIGKITCCRGYCRCAVWLKKATRGEASGVHGAKPARD